MEKNVVLRACDLSPEQRQAAELLLGEPLGGDGAVYIRMSRGRLIKPPSKVRSVSKCSAS